MIGLHGQRDQFNDNCIRSGGEILTHRGNKFCVGVNNKITAWKIKRR